LAWLRSLSFDSLTQIEPDLQRLSGRWGSKGAVGTEVEKLDESTLRVAVTWSATVWWWPSYYHAFDGFRIHRDGTYEELTEADGYDLD
jgi:hypothetical protein